MRISYRQWVRFQGQLLGLVWQTDDLSAMEDVRSASPGENAFAEQPDGVLVVDGRIVSVRSAEEYEQISHRHDFVLEEDEEALTDNVIDLDELLGLTEGPFTSDSCSDLITGWNLLGDIAVSVNESLKDRGKKADKCYDKLFWGCNLESVTPVGEHYRPLFSDAEKKIMGKVVLRGLSILESRL